MTCEKDESKVYRADAVSLECHDLLRDVQRSRPELYSRWRVISSSIIIIGAQLLGPSLQT
jgi:hypothetical protein